MGFETTFSKDVWHREAATIAIRNGIRTRRWGMRVTVYDDANPADNGDWVLEYNLANTKRQSNDNWLKVADIGVPWGGGVATVTGAGNGLSLVGTEVYLGGTLTELFTTLNLDDKIFTISGTYGSMSFQPGVGGGLTTTVTENINTSTGGVINLTAATDIDIQAGSFASLNADANASVNSQGDVNLSAVANIGSSAATIQMTASGGAIDMTTLAGAINLTSSAAFNVQAGTTMFVLSNGNMDFVGLATVQVAAQTNLALSAADQNAFLTAGQDVNIESNNANVNITADTAIFVEATAGDFTLTSGQNASITAQLQAFLSADQNVNLTSSSAEVLVTAATNFIVSAANLNLLATATMDLSATTFTLNTLAPSNPATEFFRGDGTWAVPAGGGSVTADNGLTLTGSNVQWGGPLIQNTSITGATGTHHLTMGAQLDRLGSLTTWTQQGIILNAYNGTNIAGISLTSSAGQIVMTSQSNSLIQHSSPIAAGNVMFSVLKKQSDLNTVGRIMTFTNEAGNTTPGFGMSFDYHLSNGSSSEEMAMRDEVHWDVTTNNAEYSSYSKQLMVAGSMADVLTIDTSSSSPNIFTTLFGLLILPDLPTSSAGLAAGSVWNNAGVLNIV